MNPGSHPKRRLRGAAPFVVAALFGAVIAYLLVVLYIFPVDPDTATPEVPSVVGVSFDQAEKQLTEAGFVAVRGEIRQPTGRADSGGKVLEQTPAAGTRQQVGSKVTLHTSASRTGEASPGKVGGGTPR